MGFEPGQYFRAMDSFTMTTHGALEESRESNGRPCRIGTLRVRKKSTLTVLNIADGNCVSGSGFGLASSVKLVPATQPAKGGESEIAADWTPGNCERRSRSRSNTKGSSGLGRTMATPFLAPSSLKYWPVGSVNWNVSRFFVLKPGSTCASRMKVLTLSPVPVSSMSAMAMVAATRRLLRRWREDPAVAARPESLRMDVKCRLEPCMAGMSPN